MAIDPTAIGQPSIAHVSLRQARVLRTEGGGIVFQPPSMDVVSSQKTSASGKTAATGSASRTQGTFEPHTAIVSSGGNADPDQYDSMLNRLGQKYNVPPLFLKAVMLSESGGRSDAIGDAGHSVGLFQLHDQGYGYGMGDLRFDPESNAEKAAQGLSEAWHAGQRAGYGGEYAVRAAYDYSFNPGGGFAYQGDSVVRHYNQLLAAQGKPGLT